MKRVLALVMAVFMGISLAACGKTEKKENVSQKNSKEPRIIAGSVAVAEMLNKLGVKIVGRPTTQYQLSSNLKEIPEVGLPMNPDLEKIKTLKPDLFVTSGALQDMIGNRLKENGIKTEFCNLDSYNSVKDTIKKLGSNFGKEDNANKIIDEFEKKEKEILKGVNKDKKVKVMILFGAPGHFMLSSKNSFVGSLIEELGGENIASQVNMKGQYVPFSLESALKENPDVIFRMYHGYIDEAKKQVDEEFKNNPQWRKFKAIKENKVYDLDPKTFGVTGDIKAIESLEKMKDYLYGV
ncbi:heme ABC transporter substrate-binding protein IsdE [Haloimpatiens lingqiaonensis]|uniref:heme ABC transporter substrate-binding protein IsdE n=1 Tax=Haloimpatiens lingqiaonensis TaxID=1380675 RepID=UPI0010FE88F1|nr:heme ABC transporter substrate-binding protein IsdE [Haloimpatiens lingqiaonensis]